MARGLAPVDKFVTFAHFRATGTNKRYHLSSVVMSSSSPVNFSTFARPFTTKLKQEQQFTCVRRIPSSAGCRIEQRSGNEVKSLVTGGRLADKRNWFGGSVLRGRRWSNEIPKVSVLRMENARVPGGGEGDGSGQKVPGFSPGFPAGSGNHAAASVTTGATGGGIVAEPSSVRNAAKKGSAFVPDVKLARLRGLFEKSGEGGIDAYVVPSEDAHQSEFMADSYMRRGYISGFTGSAGSVVITKNKAVLWTDGRYFLQAENQLGREWTLMRAGTPGVPLMSEWIRDNLPLGSKVGIDPYLFSSDASEELKRTIAGKDHNLVLVYENNLVDQVWGAERPSPPKNPLRVHDMKFAGIDVSTKLTNLRTELVTAGATAIVVTALDEVAWLLNLRGSDVPHSPVTYAYAIVEMDSATLYVDESKLSHEVAEHLARAEVGVSAYEQLVSDVKKLALEGCKLWVDLSKVSVAINDAFNDACSQYYSGLSGGQNQGKDVEGLAHQIGEVGEDEEANGPAAIYRLSPISLAKALKNAAELEGMKQAHLRDAAALAEFFVWLEQKIIEEKQFLTEVEVAVNLDQFRAKQSGFLETSFDTISGAGPNGAIIHYRAQPETCGPVDEHKLFLLDSGAQYVDGTTDITRTVHFGSPSSRERECFTRVLQGHIAVDRAIFPEGTPGFVLDVLARTSLWKIGLDYRHGTGHGVGAALNVHEGPHSISSRFGNMTGLQAGMIVSNEPGYYEDRAFGIRIENLVIVREVETENRFGGVTFLGFDRLTFVPIQEKLLQLSLLSEDEVVWLNEYHAEVWEKVSPIVDGDARNWLHKNTRPISPKSGSKTPGELAAQSV